MKNEKVIRELLKRIQIYGQQGLMIDEVLDKEISEALEGECETCGGTGEVDIKPRTRKEIFKGLSPCPDCQPEQPQPEQKEQLKPFIQDVINYNRERTKSSQQESELVKEAKTYFGDVRNDIQSRARMTALELCDRLEKAEKIIKDRESRLDEMIAKYESAKIFNETQQKKIAQLTEQIKKLKEYAKHRLSCICKRPPFNKDKRKCDCGLKQALSERLFE